MLPYRAEAKLQGSLKAVALLQSSAYMVFPRFLLPITSHAIHLSNFPGQPSGYMTSNLFSFLPSSQLANKFICFILYLSRGCSRATQITAAATKHAWAPFTSFSPIPEVCLLLEGSH